MAFRSDFSPKGGEVGNIFLSPQNYVNKCLELGGNTPQCETEYEQIVKNIEKSNRETTQFERDNLVSRLAPSILFFLIGVISILAAIGFWKNKKWGAIALIISTAGVSVFVLIWSVLILAGFGEIPLLLMPLIAIGWLVFETRHIKRHWLEFN